MELLEVVDQSNELTGRQEDKKIIHEKGLWHREASVWIMNEEGNVLVQKRAASKSQAPNKWGITAGHVDIGEEPVKAMQREIQEEIGLTVRKEDLEMLMIRKVQQKKWAMNNVFNHIYFLKTDTKIQGYTIQIEELSEVKYVDVEEIERVVEQQDDAYSFYDSPYIIEVLQILKEKRQELFKKTRKALGT